MGEGHNLNIDNIGNDDNDSNGTKGPIWWYTVCYHSYNAKLLKDNSWRCRRI